MSLGRSARTRRPPPRYATSEYGGEVEAGDVLDKLLRSRRGYLAHVTKTFNETELLMLDISNVSKVTKMVEKINKAFHNLKQAHKLFEINLLDEQMKADAKEFWERQVANKVEFDKHVSEWVSRAKSVVEKRESYSELPLNTINRGEHVSDWLAQTKSPAAKSEMPQTAARQHFAKLPSGKTVEFVDEVDSTCSGSSKVSSKVSAKLREAKVRQAMAATKIRQFEKEQDLKRKILELNFQTEMLKLKSDAELAELECEIWEDNDSNVGEAVDRSERTNHKFVLTTETARHQEQVRRSFMHGPTPPPDRPYLDCPAENVNFYTEPSQLDRSPSLMQTHYPSAQIEQVDTKPLPQYNDCPNATNLQLNTNTDNPQLDPRASPWDWYQRAMSVQTDACQKMVTALADTMSRPRPEYIYFEGEPIEYWKFTHNFDSNFADEKDPRKLLNFLIQFCRGKARTAIEDCVLLPPEEGYIKARDILHSTYGRPHIISRAHIDALVNGPAMRDADSDSLMQLALAMERCKLTLTQMGYNSDLNNSENLLKIVRRLPFHVKAKWVERADRLIEGGLEPSFSHLTEFVQDRARVASNMYAKDLKSSDHSKPKPGLNHGKRAGKVFSTSGTKPTSTGNAGKAHTDVKPASSCYLCKQNHRIWSCPTLLAAPVDKRRDMLREKNSCYNCLTPGHTVKGCLSKNSCKTCNARHHTILHGQSVESNSSSRKQPDHQGQETEGAAATSGSATVTSGNEASRNGETEGESPREGRAYATGAGTGRTFLQVLPVRICGVNGVREVYALLDKCADMTLISKRVVRELGIQGTACEYHVTTVNGHETRQGENVSITVESMDKAANIFLENAYTIDEIPGSKCNIPTQNELQKWKHLDGVKLNEIQDKTVELLIGAENTDAFWTDEERRGRKKEPYAMLTRLGWTVIGPSDKQAAVQEFHVNYIQSGDDLLHKQVERMWQTDFEDRSRSLSKAMSVEDKRALNTMNSSVHMVDGHYQLSLPWRQYPPPLEDNRKVVEHRLQLLKKRLVRDNTLQDKYKESMESYIVKGHATLLSPELSRQDGARWYIPHHPVFHPHKPDKVRIVFDCAARYQGTSLNEQLLSGPDLTNSLLGTLTRFREAPIALMADIEGMFNQVRVTPKDRNYLRFLWWPDGNLDAHPQEYNMNVHLFGATSSPSCASFCLKQVARDHGEKYPEAVVNTLKRNFYVDDCLKSVWSTEESKELVPQLTNLLAEGGFRLHKWISNDQDTMKAISQSDRAASIADLDLDQLPVERALGIKWDVEEDLLFFESIVMDKPYTRRGILSVVSSLFDPLGLVSPMTLPAKLILQDLCRSKYGWDEEVSEEHQRRWKSWLMDLEDIRSLKFPRCIFPKEFGRPEEVQLHHFSDASERGYGAASYMRAKNINGDIHCTLLMGKSRLAPVKVMTIPRLELSGAVVATRQDQTLRDELDIKVDQSWFWTDSTLVLQYIRNESRRFQTFVANRVMAIHDASEPSQWRHVAGIENPADHASRGIGLNEEQKISQWIKGPDFLWEEESKWPQPAPIQALSASDPEVKKSAQVHTTTETKPTVVQMLIKRCSSWSKLKRMVVWLLRFKQYCCSKYLRHNAAVTTGVIALREVHEATATIMDSVQREAFPQELACLKRGATLSSSSSVRKLSPILQDGLLRVGGRLHNAKITEDRKHPLLLPKKGPVTDMVVRYFHRVSGHSGPNFTLAALRQSFWIVNGRTAVQRVLGNCVTCKRMTARQGEQYMASLPEDRVTPDEPPFSRVGIDYFGPFLVKKGRSQQKRYGCIFTCLNSRAVHLEVANSLDTDSFICALRRFTSRRGDPKVIRSDNGTNFKGGEKELREAICSWNQSKIADHLHQHGIEWIYNPPGASHMGGVWERLIRSTRKILRGLLHEQTVTDETLSTVMTEIERIMNDRPLTALSDDPNDLSPLTPNHLLLLTNNHSLPPGLFDKTDSYPIRRWRQAQYLSNVFWRRWVQEYLPTLQERQKWYKTRRNFKTGDLVLVTSKTEPRGDWPLARVTDVHNDKHGIVRSVQVRTASSHLTRPVTSLCLLEADPPCDSKSEVVDLNKQTNTLDLPSVVDSGAVGRSNSVENRNVSQNVRPSRKMKGINPRYHYDC